jgi:hypothetical protein
MLQRGKREPRKAFREEEKGKRVACGGVVMRFALQTEWDYRVFCQERLETARRVGIPERASPANGKL